MSESLEQKKNTDLLYHKQVDAFLRSIISNHDDTNELLEQGVFRYISDHIFDLKDSSEYGVFHPISIANSMLAERNNINEFDLKRLNHLLESIFPIDNTTGYFSAESMPILLGMAHLNAQSENSNVPVCLLEGDIINLGGANEHITRDKADKLIYEMCRITREELEKSDYGRHVEVQAIRMGGDELRLVVYGREKEEIDEILKNKVYPKINMMNIKAGLNDIPHTKVNQGKTPGFGLVFGSVDLSKSRSESEIRSDLNLQIEEQKVLDGLLRFGFSEDLGIERYIKEIYTPYLNNKFKSSGVEEDSIPLLIVKEIEKNRGELLKQQKIVENNWQDLIKQGGSFFEEYQESQAKTPRQFFGYLKDKYKTQEEARLEEIYISKELSPEPFEEVEIPHRGGDSQPETRLRRVLKAFGYDDFAGDNKQLMEWNKDKQRYEMKPGKEDLYRDTYQDSVETLDVILDFMKFVEAPNIASRCRSSRFMMHDVIRLMEKTPDLQLVNFELECLNGLNAVSQPLADAALRQFGKVIHAVADDNIDNGDKNYIYHQRGTPKFRMFLPATYTKDQIKSLVSEIDEEFSRTISNLSPTKFAENTYANRHVIGDDEASKAIIQLQADIKRIEKKHNIKIDKLGDVPHPRESDKSVRSVCYVNNIDVARDASKKDKHQAILYAMRENNKNEQLLKCASK